jgi:hypothetical protein
MSTDTIVTRRPIQEGSRHLPELITVIAQYDGVRHPWKHDELAVSIGQFRKEMNQILFRRDSIVFTANKENRCMHL